MKTKINSNTFVAALKRAHEVIDPKNPQTILTHCLLRFHGETLDVCATDTVTSVSSSVTCSARNDQSVAVAGRAIYDAAKSMPAGELTIDVDGNRRVSLISDKARIAIPGIDGADFPRMPDEPEEYLPIGAKLFANAIRNTAFAASQDSARTRMACVTVAQGALSMRVFAVDGHRLSLTRMQVSLALPPVMLIPTNSAMAIASLLDEGEEDAGVGCADGKFFARLGDCTIVANLIGDEAMPVDQIIPATSESIEVGRDDLLAALRRASLMSTKDIEGAHFSLNSGTLVVESNNDAVGEARTSIAVTSKAAWRFGAKIRYMADALAAIDAPAVDLFAPTGQGAPIMIRPHGNAWQTMIVMPMKL